MEEEKQEREVLEGTPSSTDHNGSEASDPSKECGFAPINLASSRTSRPDSHEKTQSKTTSLRSIRRSRSNNGYGCDVDDSEEAVDVETAGENGVDPYEVHWENGDKDPLNPRSMSYARKWLVVIIVAASSFCV